jgi:hypothetical protein
MVNHQETTTKNKLTLSFYEWLEVDDPVAVWFKLEVYFLLLSVLFIIDVSDQYYRPDTLVI